MHDIKGRVLKVGDHVLVPMKIKNVFGGEEYCNCELESIHGRRPDGQKEKVSTINTGVVFRHNVVDSNDIDKMFDEYEGK